MRQFTVINGRKYFKENNRFGIPYSSVDSIKRIKEVNLFEIAKLDRDYLIVAGEKDPISNKKDIIKLAKMLNAEYYIVKDAGHNLMVNGEFDETMINKINEFLGC